MAAKKNTNKTPAKKAEVNRAVSTPVRNSAIPKVVAVAKPVAQRQITHAMIAQRAYEIWQSGKGGSEHDNWTRAERELRGQ